MKATAILLALSATVLLSAQPAAPQSSTQKSAQKSGPAKPSAASRTASRPSLLKPATLNAQAPSLYKVKFTATNGDFVIEVHRDWAPLGADRFYNLVRNGFFTNAAFFRVMPGFIVQFGLNASPAVNKVWHDATIQDDPVTHPNNRGSLVFASAGPNTRTTQLFINYNDNAKLDKMGFAPFGTVVEGMQTVDRIYSGHRETPSQDLIVSKGDAYLKKEFPDLDKIKLAQVIFPESVPAHAPTSGKSAGRAAPAAKTAQPKPAQH